MFLLIFIEAKKKGLLIFRHTGVRGLFLLSGVGVLFIFPSTFFLLLVPYTHTHTVTFFFPCRTIILISYVHPILILECFFSLFFRCIYNYTRSYARWSLAMHPAQQVLETVCTCIRMHTMHTNVWRYWIYLYIHLMQVSEVITRCCLAVWLNALAFKLRRTARLNYRYDRKSVDLRPK